MLACAVIFTAHASSVSADRDRITVDMAKQGAEIPKSLYGIFFEEITHSGDGGLYAEMIMNRGFEDGNLPSGTTLKDGFAVAKHGYCYSNDTINKFKVEWKAGKETNGWSVESKVGSVPQYSVVTDRPLHAATPHSLQIDLGASVSDVRVYNDGYWGIALTKGEKYNFECYLRADSKAKEQTVEIALVDKSGQVAASRQMKLNTDGEWCRYETTLKAAHTGNQYRLMLRFNTSGTVWIDYVSLFPRKTFMGRENGLRNDVGQMLADLKPAFVRWPGGCIVEGLTMDNRVKWKETIGNPMTRPGEYNLWGYRSTYGFGYHEFLQFCEDTKAEGMFVCNAGMSCLFRNGDYASSNQIDELIQEALDAIEYAIGDKNTRWGSERAKNGHPAPFPLKYVEIGNENIGSRYAANYNRFHSAIKAKYPQLTLISALMFSKNIEELNEVEIIDPHYYETADWFYNNANVYDKLPNDLPYKVYVGEYAAIGRSTLYSSLAEAAYLTGVERNADKVQLVSYAPLIENAVHGRDHLLVLKNDSVYGRTNYYVLKMFSENSPSINLETKISDENLLRPVSPSGFVGISTGNTSAQFKDFKVTRNGRVDYTTSWSDFDNSWHKARGEWRAENGVLTQPNAHGDGLIWLKDFEAGDCVIDMKARKMAGYEGFRIVFGGKDERHYFMADMGSHSNESVLFREIGDKGSVSLFDYRNQEPVYVDHWYDVRVEIKGNNWKCYMDNVLKYEYNYYDVRKHYAVSGYDKTKKEIVVKLVNGEDTPWKTTVDLKNAGKIKPQGVQIVLSDPSSGSENSFAEPLKIVPRESALNQIGSTFEYTCAPNSFVILRIPVSDK